MEIRTDDPTAPYVADLLAHHLRELQDAMGQHAFALDASGLSADGVTFWTAWDGGALLGFCALKALDDTHGEVKSMRAASAARGKGVGRAMLNHIVSEARGRNTADSAWRRARQRCTVRRSLCTAAPALRRAAHSPTIRRARTTSS